MVVVMGSGGETVARDRGRTSTSGGERVGVVQVRLYRPFPAQELLAALPATRAARRRAGPHQGARLARRAAVPRRRRRAQPRRTPTASASRHAAGDRRPLRPLLEGVHARDGRRRLRRAGARAAARRGSPIGITDDVGGHEPALRPRARHRAAADTVRAVFFGLGSDGTVGANKNTIKILGADATCTRRATSSTTRRSPARRPSRTCASGRSRSRRRTSSQQAGFVGCHQFGLLEQVDVLGRAAPGATLLLNCRAPAGPGLGRAAAARSRSRSSPRASTCTPSTPAGSPARRASPGAPTPCCRPASSRSPACCRATRRSTAIKAAIRKTYGRRGRRGGRAQPGRGRRDARRAARGRACPTA